MHKKGRTDVKGKMALLLFLMAGLLVAGCGKSLENGKGTEGAGNGKSEIRMAISIDPDGLDPHRTAAAATFQITNNIYDTLVDVTPDGQMVPGLAKDWTVSEDGLSITFHLKKGVHFHNGKEVTAEDVKYSFERLKSEESPKASNYANITDIRVDDPYTITFLTENPDTALVSNFAYPWAAIVPKDSGDELKNHPVGTGPYMLEEWVPQQHIILKKNPENADAKLETIKFIMIPDATSQILALKSGEVDIIQINGDQAAQFKKDPDYKILEMEMNAVQLMAMNSKNKALGDVRVRQAIAHAIDRKALIDTVWFGYGKEIGSHFPPMLKEYVDTTDVLPYDPEKAKQLLAEAGYDGGLTLEMYLPTAYPFYVDAGQIIAHQLKEVGIQVNIHTIEWGTWLSDVYTNRNYDLTVVGHNGRLDPYALLSRYETDSGENYMNYSNEKVDEILANIRKEKDEEKRTELFKKLQLLLAEEVPAYYIQSPILLYVTGKNVEGFRAYPIDIYEMKDVYFTKP